MKKLLLFICIINLTAAAQDSTSVSFGTETVDDFKKQNLMDEYDRAFGGNRRVNNRIKVGLVDIAYERFPANLPYLSIEQKIGKKFSAMLGSIMVNRNHTAFPIGDLFKNGFSVEFSYDANLRYYFKSNEKLSGDYLSLEFKVLTRDFLSDGLIQHRNYRSYIGRHQTSVNLGKQFGSILDIGFQAGLKNVLKTKVTEEGFTYTHKKENIQFIPFIGTYSRIGIGANFPRTKKGKAESCDFLNCYNEFNNLFKINLSNSLYLDPYYGTVKFDLAYEKKLGLLPLSLEANLVASAFSEKKFKATGNYEDSEEFKGKFFTFYPEEERKNYLQLTSSLHLKYYFLQNRSILKGKSVSNLSGEYFGAFYTYKMGGENIYTDYSPYERFLKDASKSKSGLMLGIQKKILKNYFYDFGLKYDLTSKGSVFYKLSQEIKFGYAF